MAGLRLTLDPSGVEAGAARADKALAGVGAQAVKTENALEKMATGVVVPLNKTAAAAEQVGQKSFAATGGTRMLAQQLSQVAQQGAVTGNYLGALAVQLPDIGLAFGTIGTAVGVLAMVGLPLLQQAFGGAAGAAETANKATDDYADALRTLSGDITDAKALDAEYTEAIKSGSAQRIAAIQAEALVRQKIIALDQMDLEQAKLKAAAKVAEVQAAYDLAKAHQADAAAIYDASVATNQQVQDQEAALNYLSDQSAEMAKQQLELLRVQTNYDLINAQIETGKSKLETVSDLLGEMASGTREVDAASASAASTMGGFAPAIDGGVIAANTLYGVLFDITQLSFGNLAAIPGAGFDFFGDSALAANGMVPAKPAKQPARSGGGGGGSRTEAIQEETHYLHEMAKAYEDANNAWLDWQDAGANALDRLIDGTSDLGDVLQDVIKEMELAILKQTMLATFGMSPTTSGSIGTIIMGALTGHASGGTIPVGSTGMVGENGPEPVTVTPYGAVVTSTSAASNSPSSGAPAIEVVVTGGDLVLSDNGSISARINVSAKAAASAAVSTVKRSLGSWNSQLQSDGALV